MGFNPGQSGGAGGVSGSSDSAFSNITSGDTPVFNAVIGKWQNKPGPTVDSSGNLILRTGAGIIIKDASNASWKLGASTSGTVSLTSINGGSTPVNPAITPSAVTVSVSGPIATINGSITTNSPITFDGLNLAVARDQTGYPWVVSTGDISGTTVNGTRTLSGTASLSPGNYVSYVSYSTDGQATWQIGPRYQFTVTSSSGGGSGGTVKFMPMGDSLTAVDQYAMGFKGYLLDSLLASGSSIDYVGSQVSTGPAALKDKNHEGHSGWQNSNFQSTAAGYVSTYLPNVILYHVGTNDIWSNIAPATAITRMRDVLTKIYTAKSDVHIIVCKIIPMNVGKNTEWAAYNNAIPGVVTDFKNAGRQMTLADMSAAITTSDLQGDGIHMTTSGHQKVANALYPIVKSVTG